MTDNNTDNEPCDDYSDEEYYDGPVWEKRNIRKHQRRGKKQDLKSFNWDAVNLEDDYFLEEGEWEKFYGR